MDRSRLIEREGLADDARAFRSLIAELGGARAHAPSEGDAPSITEAHVLAVLAPAAAGRNGRLASQLLAYAGSQGLAPVQLELLPYLCDLAHVLRGRWTRASRCWSMSAMIARPAMRIPRPSRTPS